MKTRCGLLVIWVLVCASGGGAPVQAAPTPITFAVIGDYGTDSTAERDVAALVKTWNPDFIITLGDNNYPDGAETTIDQNIGKHYHDFIYPYTGSYGDVGSGPNRFFPSLGNHDWHAANAQPYLNYFTLPGNERYYDFVRGDVHFFAIDSDPHEPDGITSSSVQAQWLQSRLAASTVTWQIVYFHHAPYSSSSTHGSNTTLQWPFKAWGADVVLAGHDHTYERLLVGGLPYFVNGAGGAGLYAFGPPVAGSQVRYKDNYGALRVQTDAVHMTFEFFSRAGALIDTYTVVDLTQLPHHAYLPVVRR